MIKTVQFVTISTVLFSLLGCAVVKDPNRKHPMNVAQFRVNHKNTTKHCHCRNEEQLLSEQYHRVVPRCLC